MKKYRLLLALLAVVLVIALGFLLLGEKPEAGAPFPLDEGIKLAVATDLHYLAPQLYDNGALYTQMIENADGVFLSSAKHAVRVAIDEEGVTAAAYTVMMEAGAAEPPDEEIDFTLDRPFVFAITARSGLPLFVGIVNAPE